MKYIGFHIIQANLLSGDEVKELLAINNRADDGKDYGERYLVLHDDGYQSLIQKDVFEKAHLPLDSITLEEAIVMLKELHRRLIDGGMKS